MTPPYAVVDEYNRVKIIPAKSFDAAKQLAREMSNKNMTYIAKEISEEEAARIT
jgi:hypothetical protein